jgi:quinol monooxygenase YgiN
MIIRLARYQVRKESIAAAEAATRAFVDEVTRKEGGTARYEAFQDKSEPGRFTHLMAFRTPSAEEYHRKTAWHKAFLATITPLCASPPAYEDLVKLE